jgi:hypothetical protein
MTLAIIASIALLMLGIEWLSLAVLSVWALGAALLLIVQMGEHGAL